MNCERTRSRTGRPQVEGCNLCCSRCNADGKKVGNNSLLRSVYEESIGRNDGGSVNNESQLIEQIHSNVTE